MADLGTGQKSIVMSSYPHMLPADAVIWTRYLRKPVVPMLRVWYDLHVGKPVEAAIDQPEYIRLVAFGVSRKRIDVVAKVKAGWWVIEVKPVAGPVALGQVVNYSRLFRTEYKKPGEILSVVICETVDPDSQPDYEAAGVGLIRV